MLNELLRLRQHADYHVDSNETEGNRECWQLRRSVRHRVMYLSSINAIGMTLKILAIESFR
jgi:hypothetical protein